ncbi:MAG: sn-glycerol-3-phosphate ABC transporter ATP-binding protein UgpC [Bacteroidota bacterium]
MAYIEIQNVWKSFGKTAVVKGVSLEVEKGEFLVLVGPSGCGKSTLLRMIAGLESIDDGIITIDEIILNTIPPKDRDIAMVFQNYALYPHMSVYNNLAFGLKIKGERKKEYHQKILDTADILGLSELLERKPRQLSGGQKQRIAVGRAIVRNPKAFLFDEPLSNLDAKLRVRMRADLLRLHRQQKATSLYVTHDQVEAMTMADRVAVIHGGKIQQIDTPMNVYNHPANQFVAEFMGSPPMNTISGEMHKKEDGYSFTVAGNVVFESINSPKSLPLGKLVLGIRPEDISLEPVPGPSLMSTQKLQPDLIEHMGDFSYIHINLLSDKSWTVKTGYTSKIKEGRKTRMYLNAGCLQFFDKKTGETLYE